MRNRHFYEREFDEHQSSLSSNYLQDIVPHLVQDGNPYKLRNSSDICTIYTNTNLFYNSFHPSIITEWNNLAQGIKDASSGASFKYQLIRETRNRAPLLNLSLQMMEMYHYF